MKADDSAVGGFFEDLPVLVFVLGGVSMLIASSLWANAFASDARLDRELSYACDCAVEAVVLELTSDGTSFPTVQKLCSASLAQIVAMIPGGHEWAASIWLLHPELVCLRAENSSGQVPPDRASSSRGLFCALDGAGDVVPVEVRMIVWKSL